MCKNMRPGSCLEKILFLLSLCLLDEICAQRRPFSYYGYNSIDQDCPSGNSCLGIKRCSGKVLRGCGYSFDWRRKVCCPTRRQFPDQRPELIPPRRESRTDVEVFQPQEPTQETYVPGLQDCPSGTNCMVRKKCRPYVMKLLRETPKACGHTYNGKERICCPQLPDATTTTRPITSETLVVTPRHRSQGCGRVKGVKGFVMGGKAPKNGDFPWMVEIAIRDREWKFTHLCTGAMISSKHVLSAAHCFHRKDPSLYVAKIGDVDRTKAKDYGIIRIRVPVNYAKRQHYNDIAVLTLSTDVSSDVARPICLPESSEYINLAGKGTTAAGWGFTSINQKEPSTKLMALSGIPIIPNKECNSIFYQKMITAIREFPRGITDGMICAGFLDGIRDTCRGDSGGPLMYMKGDHWYIVGIVSFGVQDKGCSENPDYPGGYTRVSKYLDWILQQIKS